MHNSHASMLRENMTLPVSQLRAFVAIVEIGTVTGASSAIGRTQPQVSRLVAELEESIGFLLFIRERRRLVLTRQGARFYDQVKHTLDGLDNIRHLAEQIRDGGESGPRILAPAYIAHTILPRALAKFRARFPKRYFSVEIVSRNAMGSWLSFRPFDIGIAALPFELPATKVQRFARMKTVVVLPKHHPLTGKQVITLAELAAYPFVAANRNTAIRKTVDRAFEAEGLKPIIIGDTTTSVSACDMVAQGMGLTIVDAFVPLARGGDSIETRPWMPGSTTDFGFLYPAASPTRTIGEEFSVFVEEAVKELGSTHGTNVQP
jgi:DNA-binding transcriptional LysR family regulator